MEQKKTKADKSQEFLERAKTVFGKYDVEGSHEVGAWDAKEALAEMGHVISDAVLFNMLRTNDGEKGSVSFEKFLQMCDTDLTEGGGSFAKRNIRHDQAEAWEAAGGKADLTGEVDVHKLKKIFDLFELTTGVDAIIQQGDGMVEYSDFCALLESKSLDGLGMEERQLITPDMRSLSETERVQAVKRRDNVFLCYCVDIRRPFDEPLARKYKKAPSR